MSDPSQDLAGAQQQRDDALLELQQARVDHATAAAAGKFGMTAEAAAALVDPAAIEYDENGQPTNIEQLVDDARPSLNRSIRRAAGYPPGRP